jgi:hypothetical protein
MPKNMRESEGGRALVAARLSSRQLFRLTTQPPTSQQTEDAQALTVRSRKPCRQVTSMNKNAAATALAIVLTTMIALTVSASVTPANARPAPPCPASPDTVTAWAHIFGVSRSLSSEYYCMCQCWIDHARRQYPLNDKKYQACSPKCVNAFEVSRR